jgi:adenylate cyclase
VNGQDPRNERLDADPARSQREAPGEARDPANHEKRPPTSRRLAAILAADVVGYSRLMEADEDGTHGRVKALVADLINPQLAEHSGRIFKTMGDGILIEFPSAVHAVKNAIEMQRAISARNAQAPVGGPIEFRIGVNLGDVIVDDGDLFGDGVNIAARLQQLAEPGQIYVSGEVVRFVEGRAPLSFDDLGEHHLKNISRLVRVFRVRDIATPAGGGSVFKALLARLVRAPLFARTLGILVVALAIAAAGTRYVPPLFSPTGDARAELTIPQDRPSLAVLPFTTFESGEGEGPASSYFIDGVTEDLITDLAKISGIFVISRNSSFAYRGAAIDVRRVGRELGVRFVLEGSLRHQRDVFRINAQLIDSTTGAHVWADRFDEAERDLFGLQDTITRRIVEALQVQLTVGEAGRIAERGTQSLVAYDAFLQGVAHLRQRTHGDLGNALALLQRAVALDPGFSRAHAALAQLYLMAFRLYWHKDIGLGDRYDALALARRELREALGRPNALARRAQAQLYYYQDRHPEALMEIESAIAIEPGDADNYALKGLILTLMGRPAEAIPEIQRAQRLDPKYPSSYLGYLGEAYFVLERFDEARQLLEQARKDNAEYYIPLIHLTATDGWLGRKDEAVAALATLNALRRELGLGPYRIEVARREALYYRPIDRERLTQGLEQAGVQ